MSKVAFLIPWCVTKRELTGFFFFYFFLIFFFIFFFTDSWAQFLKVGHESDKSSSWVT